MDRVHRGGPCFVYVHHALSATMSLNTTEVVLQTQKHSETFVEKKHRFLHLKKYLLSLYHIFKNAFERILKT